MSQQSVAQIREQVIRTLASSEQLPLVINAAVISDATRLRDELALDSIQVMVLTLALEKTFGVPLDILDCDTIGEVVAVVAMARSD